MNTEIEKTQATEPEQEQRPEKAAYLEKIKELPPEDQAFMDGYLFAKVTSRRQPA